MKEYDFTLKYRLGSPNEDAGKYLEALADAGCEDAVVGIGQNGRISLNFVREAETALEAIASAISNVQKAIPEAKLGDFSERTYRWENRRSEFIRTNYSGAETLPYCH